MPSTFSFSFESQVEITVNHELNDPAVFWTLYTEDGVGFFPGTVENLDADHTRFTFGSLPTSGYGTIFSIRDLTLTSDGDAFTSILSVQNFLGITTSGSEIRIAAGIASVTKNMQNFMDRRIVETDHVDERHQGFGQRTLLLDDYPVVASSVVLRQDETAVGASEYVVNAGTGEITRKSSGFSRASYPNIGVDYTSGFPEGVPQDLNNACVKQVAYELQLQGEKNPAINLKSGTIIGVISETYQEEEWARGVRETLLRYRRQE